MKKTALLIFFLMLSAAIVIGCSSNRLNRGYGPRRNLNMTEEERQQMFGEMQQKAIESCKDKNEGDSCQLESPRGEISGVCNLREENLVCTSDIPMRQGQQ